MVLLQLEEGGSLNIVGGTEFKNNYVSGGGFSKPVENNHGMFYLNDASVSLNDVTFSNNRIKWEGIFVTSGTVSLSNTYFIDNTMPTLILHQQTEYTLSLEGIEFYGNSITVYGNDEDLQILALIDASNITITDCDFVNNSDSC